MTISPPPGRSSESHPQFKGRLARRMSLILVGMAVIPLLVMGGIAYWYTHQLLVDQVSAQIETAVNVQAEQVRSSISVKTTRLDRITRQKEFAKALDASLPISRSSDQFGRLRATIINQFEEINRQEGSPVFNNFFFMRKDGRIQVTTIVKDGRSQEGVDLSKSTVFELLSSNEAHTIAVYNLEPLYPNQLVFLTIEPYEGFGGVTGTGGMLVGVSEAKNIQSILSSISNYNKNFNAYFVTADNYFIGIDPYRKELAAFEPTQAQREAFSAETLQGNLNTGMVDFINPDQDRVLARGQWADFLNTGIVVEIPRETVLGQLDKLAPVMGSLIGGSALLMILVVWLATSALVEPISRLTNVTRRFAEGDFQERYQTKRKDEIGLLAWSFNRMADDLNVMYRSLESQVEDRTQQIRTAAEIAQDITSSINLDELLNKTTKLIVERFNFYHAGIFLLDRAGKQATLRAAYSPAAETMLSQGHSLEVGSQSIIGWVAENNQPRVASDVGEDPVHFKNPLLPETRSEVGVPISAGSLMLGALDVQSTKPDAFDAETVVTLQTLANQIATAMQNVSLIESTEVNLSELERLYRASRQIAEVQTEDDILSVTGRVLAESPYISILLAQRNRGFEVITATDPEGGKIQADTLNRRVDITPEQLASNLTSGLVILDLNRPVPFPSAVIRIARQAGCQVVAILPVTSQGKLSALVMLGTRQRRLLTAATMQPYANLIDFVATSLDKVEAAYSTNRRLSEMESLATLSQSVMQATDLQSFFAIMHEQIRQTLGDYSFMVALYDKSREIISVPYIYENGQVSTLESFPLGEGLTSILIRTHQPLMLVEDVDKRLAALGAKTFGKPAKSWLGTPLLASGEAIGALIMQDTQREFQFDEDDLRFMNAVAVQVAGAIYNIRLLDESRQQSVQLQTAAEIARDISHSLNLDELLHNAVHLIRDRFGFYHAAVFLVDPTGEYAVIREATGDAGAQMKRIGHKLGVGSKSIVGYVVSRGEHLIVSDTTKDVTYFANPLLPDTRSEAALPLKVGERIVGALDVQSNIPLAFTENKLQTLQILADQLAVAVVNSELFAETQENLSQHRLLHHVTSAAASGTTLEEALESSVQGLQVTLGGDRVTILLLNKEQKALEIASSVGYSQEDVMNTSVPVGTGVTGWAAAHRKPVRIDNVETDPRYIQLSSNTRSELAIPLIYRNEVLGVLNVESEQAAAYTENDEELLGTLGGSLAAIIANARLLDQIRKQADRERMLFEISSKIRRSTDMQTILVTTTNEIARMVNARRTQVKIGDQGEPANPQTDNQER